MHHSKGEKRRGFVLVYTILIASLCSAAALACFRLQILRRDNNISYIKQVQRIDYVQRDRENLLTDIDSFIYSRLTEMSCQQIKELFRNESLFKIYCGGSSAEYIAVLDAFYLCYYIDGKFSLEELYRYDFGEKGVVYTPVAFSYKKGTVKQ
jgi:hypothetical protein